MSQEQTLHPTELLPQYKDDLTGYPNRLWLNENLPAIMEAYPGACGVLFIDLDGLKKENDANGHEAGNKLIINAANKVDGLIRHPDDERPGDNLAQLVRLSGDELVVVLKNVHSDEDIDTVKNRIQHNLDEEHMPASVGGALNSKDSAETASQLLNRADIAMFADKESRKKERFEALPKRRRLAAKFGNKLLAYAGVNPPRQ